MRNGNLAGHITESCSAQQLSESTRENIAWYCANPRAIPQRLAELDCERRTLEEALRDDGTQRIDMVAAICTIPEDLCLLVEAHLRLA